MKKSSKKNIFILGMVVLTILVVYFALNLKKDEQNSSEEVETEHEVFLIKKEAKTKVKGTSIIAQEQKILIDPSMGELSEIFIKNRQRVKKGDVLFSYYNEEIENELKEVQADINARTKELKNLSAYQFEEDSSFIQEGDHNNLQNEIDELALERDRLKEERYPEVSAAIDGIVYLKEEAIYDDSVELIHLVSDQSMIEVNVSELEIEELSEGDESIIHVLSNDELVKGEIVEVSDLPKENAEEGSSLYSVKIEAEEAIRPGFSVEVAVQPKDILIPKKFVQLEDEQKFVYVEEEDDEVEKIEIQATLKNNKYQLDDASLADGDQLIIPSARGESDD